jgi:Omp85 superfamily domain
MTFHKLKTIARTLPLFLCFSFIVSISYSREIKFLQKSPKETIKPKEEIKKAIITSTETLKESLFGKIISHMVIPLDAGPIIPLPIVDSSKDLGLNYGIMPIWAIRDKKKGIISSVIAPSFNYNNFLGTTLIYRHYLFPDETKLFVFRAQYSQNVQKEIYLNYYTPEFLGTRGRLNWEFRHWINGKASFYGYGPHSLKNNKANYALHMTGEEFTATVPLYKNLYFDFMHMWYSKKVSNGPVETLLRIQDISTNIPYSDLSKRKGFHTNKFSILYDDTDHPFLPKIGTNAKISVLYSTEFLGSDYDYRTYSAEVKHYYNHKDEGKFVTAIRYFYEFQRGDELPFYAQSTLGESTGLRMAGDGRFVGRGKFMLNIEERITLSKVPVLKFVSELEIAPFLDMGTVFDKPSLFTFSNMKYGPGIALRLVMRPQVVGTMDIAFGSEGTNVIISVGYPF